MKPGLAQFGSSQPVKVVEVDLDKKGSPAYKKYMKYFQGRSIPFSVLLNDKGEVVHKMRGGRSYSQLVQETSRFLK